MVHPRGVALMGLLVVSTPARAECPSQARMSEAYQAAKSKLAALEKAEKRCAAPTQLGSSCAAEQPVARAAVDATMALVGTSAEALGEGCAQPGPARKALAYARDGVAYALHLERQWVGGWQSLGISIASLETSGPGSLAWPMADGKAAIVSVVDAKEVGDLMQSWEAVRAHGLGVLDANAVQAAPEE